MKFKIVEFTGVTALGSGEGGGQTVDGNDGPPVFGKSGEKTTVVKRHKMKATPDKEKKKKGKNEKRKKGTTHRPKPV